MAIVRIQLRRDTAADWTSANPVLAEGEIGLETDTDQFKIGDGATVWSSLAYGGIVGPQGIQGVQGESGTIAVGTTATGAEGTNASVVNSGTSTEAIFDFTIPKGDTGDTGPAGQDGSTKLETVFLLMGA